MGQTNSQPTIENSQVLDPVKVQNSGASDYIQKGPATSIDNVQECNKMSNDHTAYITKQYITILKATENMIEIETNLKGNQAIPDPSVYLIDTSKVLADLLFVPQLQSSVDIFKPVQKISGVNNGRAIMKNYTVLDKYNDFFLTEYNILQTDSEKSARAKQIHSELDETSARLLIVLKGACSDIGRMVQTPAQINAEIDSLMVEALGNRVNNNARVQEILDFVRRKYPDISGKFLDTFNNTPLTQV